MSVLLNLMRNGFAGVAQKK